jgi:outer membrane protein
MKIILCSSLLLFAITLVSYAQTGKGGFLVGGNFELDSGTNQRTDYSGSAYSEKSSFMQINPIAGFFAFKNFAIGLSPGYRRQKTVRDMGMTTETFIVNRYSIAPFARYYVPFNPKLSLFFHALLFEYGYGIANSVSQTYDVRREHESITRSLSPGIDIRPGLVYFATKRIGIEATIGAVGYRVTSNKTRTVDDGVPSKSSSKNKNATALFNPMSVSVGLQVYLYR